MAVKMPSKQVQAQEYGSQEQTNQKIVQHLQAPVLQITPEQALVNEYVMCATEVEPYKPMMKTMEEARKKLQSIAAEHPAHEPVTIEGTNGMAVTFKAAGEVRRITDMNGLIGALKKKISYEDLMGMLSISLTDLDKILSPMEQEPFVTKVEGSRVLAGFKKADDEQSADV